MPYSKCEDTDPFVLRRKLFNVGLIDWTVYFPYAVLIAPSSFKEMD
jgi:hypothetical protein